MPDQHCDEDEKTHKKALTVFCKILDTFSRGKISVDLGKKISILMLSLALYTDRL